MFHISQNPTACLTSIEEAEPEPTDSVINKKSSAGDNSDWRKPIVDYLCNPSERVDKDVRRMAFKYTMRDDGLYRRTVDDVLLKSLDED